MIEVWGRRNSNNVMSVMWALGEIGLEYRRYDIGGSFGGFDDPSYRGMNPNLFVPTLRDNDLVIFESNAIVRYLCAKYSAGSLWPEDATRRVMSDQWMEWCKATLYGKFMPAFLGKIRTLPDQQNPDAIQQSVNATNKAMAILNQHLEKNKYVGGEVLSIGDFPLGALLHRYFQLDITRGDVPFVEAWYNRLCQRPAYQHHCMISFGTNFEEWKKLEAASAGIQ